MVRLASIADRRARSSNLLLASVQFSTLNDYVRSIQTFVAWCEPRNFKADLSLPELDLLIATYFQHQFLAYKGSRFKLYNDLPSAIATFIPQWRGHFPIASRCLKGWRKLVPSESYPPLTWDLACLIACELARAGQSRLAVGVVLSFDCLLRVNELMELKAGDVMLAGDLRLGAVPTEARLGKTGYTGVALRIRAAKTGTNQFVAVRDERVARLLALAVRGLPDDAYIFPAKRVDRGAAFRYYFKSALKRLGLDERFVPHSLRHGGATFLANIGVPLADIAYRGRWKSFASAAHYVQIGRALLATTKVAANLRQAAAVLSQDIYKAVTLAQINRR